MRRRAGEAIYWRARNIARCKYDAPKLVVERHLWRMKSCFVLLTLQMWRFVV